MRLFAAAPDAVFKGGRSVAGISNGFQPLFCFASFNNPYFICVLPVHVWPCVALACLLLSVCVVCVDLVAVLCCVCCMIGEIYL